MAACKSRAHACTLTEPCDREQHAKVEQVPEGVEDPQHRPTLVQAVGHNEGHLPEDPPAVSKYVRT